MTVFSLLEGLHPPKKLFHFSTPFLSEPQKILGETANREALSYVNFSAFPLNLPQVLLFFSQLCFQTHPITRSIFYPHFRKTELYIRQFSYNFSPKYLHSFLLHWKTSKSIFEKESSMLNLKPEHTKPLSLSDGTGIK